MSGSAFKFKSTKSQSENEIRILTLYCRILQTVANLQTYDACECSCLRWICTGSVPLSCKTPSHGALQIYTIVYVRIKYYCCQFA
jgi:hypothetical protein